ncbi:MAG TPA: hypothetical protein PLE30_08915 [Candidatus Kapabacteria bacterium]|nr:hypothetical protein [Candidatus Kapabacteria bacterium]
MIKLYILIFASILLIASCSPISKSARVGSHNNTTASKNAQSDKNTIDNRTKAITHPNDTLVIQMPDVISKPQPNIDKSNKETMAGQEFGSKPPKESQEEFISKELDIAIGLYEQNKIDNAQKKIISILSTIDSNNVYYNKAKYFLTECNIAKKQLSIAKKSLNELYNTGSLEAELAEKVILRLGQLSCLQKDINGAVKYFVELKERFPNSELLPLANCDFIKKK